MRTKPLFLHFSLFLAFSLACTGVFSQKISHVVGEAQMKVEDHMTKEQAREKVKELAMIDAVQNEFGSYVGQETDIEVAEGKVSYNIIGGTKVKGEWVRTKDIGFTEDSRTTTGEYGKEHETWITCRIKGVAKKAIPKARLFVQSLNCPMITCRTEDYQSGESLYLHFKSPVHGYLSVFLSDGKTVYRLLPYDDMQEGNIKSVFVEADKEYILFNKEHNNMDGVKADEYELYTYMEIEDNDLYIVFAEAPYSKPILEQGQDLSEYKENYRIPKSLDADDFEEWLADNKALMESFQVIRNRITISK